MPYKLTYFYVNSTHKWEHEFFDYVSFRDWFKTFRPFITNVKAYRDDEEIELW